LALEPGTGVIWAALREEDLKTVRQEGGERLVGSAPFKAAMLGLPAQGNALVYSSPRLMVELSGLLKAAEQHLPVDTWSGIALASAYLPALAGPPLPYAAVLANNDDGILLASNGPEAIKGRSMMGSSGMVVALAAMATPQIFKALSRAQLAQDISGARFVVLSLHSYAMDHDGEFPPNLDVLVASGYLEDASVLTMKCEDKQMRPWSYRTGLTHVSTPDRILLYGPQAVGGKRIVACVDGSVRSMLEARFQELLVAQDKVED